MSKSFCYRLYQTTLSWNVLFGTLVGLIILMWFSVANWIQYRQFAGDITYAAMCGEFIDAIYNSHARSGFNLFAPIQQSFQELACFAMTTTADTSTPYSFAPAREGIFGILYCAVASLVGWQYFYQSLSAVRFLCV